MLKLLPFSSSSVEVSTAKSRAGMELYSDSGKICRALGSQQIVQDEERQYNVPVPGLSVLPLGMLKLETSRPSRTSQDMSKLLRLFWPQVAILLGKLKG